ncbi:MAG TPA: UvrD-helicase domain-containing protein [Chitinophagales bacterium]
MLTVYKASAGSGKTFTLVKEYLRICIQSENTEKYRNILAITFTNKACNEMKERIIRTLHGFAGNDTSTSSAIKTDETMLKLLCTETQKSEEKIRFFAKEMLHKLLQDYSGLSIMTIDSFIHKVIRGFSVDLELPHNFEVHLDKEKLLDLIVENVLDEVTDDEENALTKALIEFTESKMDDGKGWNIESALREFTSELLREESFAHLKEVAKISAEQIELLRKKLATTTKEFEKTLNAKGAQALDLIASNNLSVDDFFQKKSGIFGYFSKLKTFPEKDPEVNSYVEKTLSEDKWTSSKDNNVIAKIDGIKVDLLEIVASAISYVEENAKRYYLFKLIAKNINQIRVAEAISRAYEKVKEDENILPISAFQPTVYEKVSTQDIVDIYERIGEKYDSIMIDEFQDTSILQFRNLLPLIENSQFKSEYSLVVGDAKQSIYRWKGGEAQQIVDLFNKKIFGSKNDMMLQGREIAINNYGIESKTLKSNFRSRKDIVQFNNELYETLLHFSDSAKEIYEQHAQLFSEEKDGGYVRIEEIQKSKIKNQNDVGETLALLDEIDTTEIKNNRVLEIIQDCKTHGYEAGDVAILVRNNKRGVELAEFLIGNKYDVETSESLLFTESEDVCVLLALVQYLSNRYEKLYRYELLKQCGIALENDFNENSQLLRSSHFDFDKIISTHCGQVFNSDELQQTNLFEICVRGIRIFKLNEANVFVSSFLDLISEQQQKRNTLADFLEWWNEDGKKKSIAQNASANAVKIMSIHKSKGLEFPVVILPDCDWRIERGQDNVWLENIPDVDVSPLLVQMDSSLKKTDHADLFLAEERKSEIDTMNLLYVATTRASERLYMLFEPSNFGKEKEITRANHYLQKFLEKRNEFQNGVFEFGKGETRKLQKHKEQNAKAEKLALQNLRSENNYTVILKATTDKALNEEQIYGNKLHALIDLIASSGNTALAQQKLLLEEEAEQLQNDIDFILQNAELAPYFSDNYTRLTEFEILDEKGEIHKPDFIAINKLTKEISVLDFKTGKEQAKYEKQVQTYISLLEKGNRKVANGYLVYTQEKKIEKV